MQHTDYVTTLFDGLSNPNKVTVALTMALNAVKLGHSATLILMVEAVELGKPNILANVNIGSPFEPAQDLLESFLSSGGKVVICRACMIHNGFTEADMDQRFGYITAPEVVSLLMAAKGSLQLT